MAYDGLMFYNEVELFNVSRTATLAETLGIDAVWVSPSSVEWIRQAFGNPNYSTVTTAPWYDVGAPASSEFAGVLPLSVAGLSDSSLTSTPVEFITDGGVPGRARHATQDLVFSAAIVASTERGAAYGLRWLNKVLAATGNLSHHAGFPLAYLDSERGEGLRRHNVRVTRGVSVTRKRTTDCSSVWLVTFTLNSADPFAYGPTTVRVDTLGPKVGGGAAVGPGIVNNGSLTYVLTAPPAPNYRPILDPEFPALLTPPSTPDPLPTQWPFPVGSTLYRYWARISVMEPSAMPVVPIFTVQSDTAFRGARLSVWDYVDSGSLTEQHNFLFSTSFGYIPAGPTITVDGQKKQVYATTGKRRAESLVFNSVGGPLDWTTIRPSHPNGELLVAIDVRGDGIDARCSLSLAQKHE